MAALHRELVARRRWLDAQQFGLSYGLARATPGTNLLALCAGAAWQIRGIRAALLAVAAVTVPSSIFILGLTVAYGRLRQIPLTSAIVGATLAAAVGMMFAAAWQLLRARAGKRTALRTAALFGAACALLILDLLHPLTVLGLAAITGLLWRERS